MKESNLFGQIIKSTIYSLMISVGGVLIFAIVIKYSKIDVDTIQGINQAIKTLSIICGVLICVRNDKGLIKGSTSGTAYVLLSYLIFSLIEGKFEIGWSQLIDLATGIIGGGLSGVLGVNLIKQKGKTVDKKRKFNYN